MPLQANELFTPLTIASVGSATVAVTAVTTVFKKFSSKDPKWAAFAASLVIAYGIVWFKAPRESFEWILAFFNACLLFCTALGLNETGARAVEPTGQGAADARPLIASWFKKR